MEQQPLPADQTEKIDRYLLQQMTAEEMVAFQDAMRNEPALTAAVEAQRLLILGMRRAGMEQDIEDMHRQLKTPAKVVAFPVRWLAIAAGIAGLLLSFFWMYNARNTEKRLYARYFTPDPGLITAMGSSDQYAFDRAMVDYKTGKYAAAIGAWMPLLKAKPGNDSLQYFIGVAALANGEAAAAIPFLEKTAKQSNSVFASDAWWYLGLAWLQEKQKDKAIAALRSSRHEKATALLQELEK